MNAKRVEVAIGGLGFGAESIANWTGVRLCAHPSALAGRKIVALSKV